MNGFRYVGNLFGSAEPLTRRIKVADSTTITKGDSVMFSSGRLAVGTAGSKVIGVANETLTSAATSVSFAETIVARPGDLFIADNDNVGTTFAATHVGTYFDVVGATNAQQIDTSTTTTTGTWLCLEYNPQGHGLDSDVSIGLFTPAETVFDGRTA